MLRCMIWRHMIYVSKKNMKDIASSSKTSNNELTVNIMCLSLTMMVDSTCGSLDKQQGRSIRLRINKLILMLFYLLTPTQFATKCSQTQTSPAVSRTTTLFSSIFFIVGRLTATSSYGTSKRERSKDRCVFRSLIVMLKTFLINVFIVLKIMRFTRFSDKETHLQLTQMTSQNIELKELRIRILDKWF
jgi:hypothetical protein